MKILKILGIIILSATISFGSAFVFYFKVPLGWLEVDKPVRLGTTITTINGTDTISSSRAVINTNFSNLNDGKIENSTTSVASITTLNSLTSATSLATLSALTSVGTIASGIWHALFATSTDPTVTEEGEMAFNTTTASTSLRAYLGGSEKPIFFSRDKSIVLASSTLVYIGTYATNATTTLLLANHLRPITLNNFYCKTNKGTVWIAFGDGSATTTALQCTTSGATRTPGSNNTWTIREGFKLDVGTEASDPDIITITANISDEAD